MREYASLKPLHSVAYTLTPCAYNFLQHIYVSACTLHPKTREETPTIWIRISFYDTSPNIPLNSSNIYLVHFPGSDTILCGSNIRPDVKQFVLQVRTHFTCFFFCTHHLTLTELSPRFWWRLLMLQHYGSRISRASI